MLCSNYSLIRLKNLPDLFQPIASGCSYLIKANTSIILANFSMKFEFLFCLGIYGFKYVFYKHYRANIKICFKVILKIKGKSNKQAFLDSLQFIVGFNYSVNLSYHIGCGSIINFEVIL
jgi:hypothetical protein